MLAAALARVTRGVVSVGVHFWGDADAEDIKVWREGGWLVSVGLSVSVGSHFWDDADAEDIKVRRGEGLVGACGRVSR